jgi:putative ABC transport system permease protein
VLKNYFKSAIRNLLRQKVYSVINITGLALGIAITIFILLYVVTELSYDNYHQYKDRIYRVAQLEKTQHHTSIDPSTAPPLAPALKRDFPEVQEAARVLTSSNRTVRYGEKIFTEEHFMSADPELFAILTIPFIQGDQATALQRPGTIVLSQRMAKKYFGDISPLGKTIMVNQRPFEITGVAANSPRNTHLKYDLIASLKFEKEPESFSHWMYHVAYSYIKLAPHIDVKAFEKKMCKIGDRYAKDLFERSGYQYTFFLQPVPALHLYPCPHSEPEPPGNPLLLIIFSLVGIMILVIACLNFINLSTARAWKRVKEVGIRKTIGARRPHLVRQFLGETFFMAAVAVLLALMLVDLSLPLINNLTGLQFTRQDMVQHNVPVFLVGILLMVTLFSGAYPAFYLSRFDPVAIFKNNIKTNRKSIFRKSLVVSQFVISIVLIIGTLVAYKQLVFMMDYNLGFENEQKLILPVRGRVSLEKNYDSVKSEFLKHPGITHASASSQVPGEEMVMLYTGLAGQVDEKKQSMVYIFFDQDFISQFKIQLAAGRNFRKGDEKGAFIINEAALEAFGWQSPQDALGKQVETGFGRNGEIIGVCKNFHYEGLQKEVAPLVADIYPRTFAKINLTVQTENLREILSFTEKKWQELFPASPFEYFFLDESFNKQYHQEQMTSKLMAVFTILGIFIASLGLYGLASYTAEQSTKEIGIRKVFGASVLNVTGLLTKEFIKWVILANIPAWPIAYYAANQLLKNFAYRTSIGLEVFFISGLLALIIAALTVSYQSIKAATANPIKTLRYE